MISDSSIIKFLDDYLDIKNIEDDSNNGVQVDSASDIGKIGFSVDARKDTIKEAVQEDCDLLVTHHGIIWGGLERVTDLNYEIINNLISNNVGLYTAHLPLDIHPEIGNNSSIVNIVNGNQVETFYEYNGSEIALLGDFDHPRDLHKISEDLEIELDHEIDLVNLGPDEINKFAVLTGDGGKIVESAVEKGADLLITGERDYTAYNKAKDYDINIIFGGHYSTETLGLKNLKNIIEEKFGIDTIFINRKTIY